MLVRRNRTLSQTRLRRPDEGIADFRPEAMSPDEVSFSTALGVASDVAHIGAVLGSMCACMHAYIHVPIYIHIYIYIYYMYTYTREYGPTPVHLVLGGLDPVRLRKPQAEA